MTELKKKTIDMLVFIRIFLRYLKGICVIKFLSIDNYLIPSLCGFRKGFSTQHFLTVMLEK